jgi:hypothetical protein
MRPTRNDEFLLVLEFYVCIYEYLVIYFHHAHLVFYIHHVYLVFDFHHACVVIYIHHAA